MIFVIGDIHGMLDPLKIGIDYLHHVSLKKVPISKVIFLGDYVDCGPSSKEVIDLIIKLRNDYEVITLMGNHEEMLLSFYNRVANFGEVGNYWLNYNGGIQTVQSLYPQSILFQTTFYPDDKEVSDKLQYDNVFKLEEPYLSFLQNLQLSYKQKIKTATHEFDLLFCHAVPSVQLSLDEQIKLANWTELQNYMQTKQLELEETHLWGRQLLTQQLQPNTILIHGHTPTHLYRQMTKLLKFWEDEENIPYVVRDKRNHQIAQIDIDTGLIYGGALTMLAIDDSGQSDNLFPFYLSVDPKKGYRNKLFIKQDLDLK